MTKIMANPSCWCGNEDLVAFCPEYLRCPACETLVSVRMPGPEIAHVTDEEADLYGREYWFAHQEKQFGNPNIVERARRDLPERCLYWLRTLLRYRRPPARVLELGCAHGGFVAMMRAAGFEAAGIEISPWVVEFARTTFEVPMLQGPVEERGIAKASLDVIVLMDVLEHLHDPLASMRHCLGLLEPDGIMVIQTPRYLEGSSYEDMAAGTGRRLEILQSDEHLYLFSHRSIGDLFRRLGARHIVFEPALFAEYDMFPVVSRARLDPRPGTGFDEPLSATPAARMVQALLDLGMETDVLKQRYAEAEEDRARRLEVIHDQGRRLGEAEGALLNLGMETDILKQQYAEAEEDRARRLEVIHDQGRRLGEVEAQRDHLGRRLGEVEAQRDHLEAERNQLAVEADTQRRQLRTTMAQLRTLQQLLPALEKSQIFRLLRRMGCWQWVDRILEQAVAETGGTGHERQGIAWNASLAAADVYRASIDSFNASEPNRELLDAIRAHHHRTLDELNAITPLKSTHLLDIGASPHGYALERALEHGVTLYVGVGLDISQPRCILGDVGNIGLLLPLDTSALPFPEEMFDAALSVSGFERITYVDGALAELARLIKPAGRALLTFDSIWSCSHGHHLLHLSDCAKLIPPWGHLTNLPERMRELLAPRWPESAALSLDQAIRWIYFDRRINRLTIRDYREIFARSPLQVEWAVDLKDTAFDPAAAREVALTTGMSVEDLTTRGMSVLLRRDA